MASSSREASAKVKAEKLRSDEKGKRMAQFCMSENNRLCHDLTLSTAEQRYCLLFQQSLAGIYTTTIDGVIVDCNDAMASMLRYDSREGLMARAASDLYFGDVDRRAFLRRLRRKGKLVNSECVLRCSDGAPIHVLENVALVPDEQGSPSIIHGNMVDITDRKRAEDALRESERRHRTMANELRRLADHQEKVREGERARIARELHDEFGQALTALNMDLHWLATRSSNDSSEVGLRIRAMTRLVASTTETLQRICTDLRPTVLDDFGLIAAIDWGAKQFQRRTGVLCRVRLPRKNRCPLPSDQATSVFRIFQKSLTNVGRHAHATEVNVILRIKNGQVTMSVSDNGVGTRADQISSTESLGLIGMRERALAWRGHVEFTASPSKGSTVSLRMPVAPNGTEDDR
ncbi:MAG: PAS domain S-box protein [Phycisphaerae bacterium]|nr:PAS domain S-box protein [Phycisphaerae bacterium]